MPLALKCAGRSSPLASLGHTFNTLWHVITKKSHVLSKLTILCWASFTAILGCMQPKSIEIIEVVKRKFRLSCNCFSVYFLDVCMLSSKRETRYTGFPKLFSITKIVSHGASSGTILWGLGPAHTVAQLQKRKSATCKAYSLHSAGSVPEGGTEPQSFGCLLVFKIHMIPECFAFMKLEKSWKIAGVIQSFTTTGTNWLLMSR